MHTKTRTMEFSLFHKRYLYDYFAITVLSIGEKQESVKQRNEGRKELSESLSYCSLLHMELYYLLKFCVWRRKH